MISLPNKTIVQILLLPVILSSVSVHADFLEQLGWVDDSEKGSCYGYFAQPKRPPWSDNMPYNKFIVTADRQGLLNKEKVELSGNVHVAYQNLLLQSQRAMWVRSKKPIIYLHEQVRFHGKGLLAVGLNAVYEKDKDIATINDAVFRVHLNRSHHTRTVWGKSKRLVYSISKNKMDLADVEMSLCSPRYPIWGFLADKALLNYDTMLGTAHHAFLRLFGLPVMYSPWLQFPLTGERLTGFLWPTIGYNRLGGVTIVQPFYWNLAPEQDMRLSAVLGIRHLQGLAALYRYLSPWGMAKLSANLLYGKSHWFYSYSIVSDLKWKGAYLNVKQINVSDTDFNSNFPLLRASSSSLLPQSYELGMNGSMGHAKLYWSAYQDLNNISDETMIGSYQVKPGFNWEMYRTDDHVDLSQTLSARSLKPVSSKPLMPKGTELVWLPTLKAHTNAAMGRLTTAMSVVVNKISSDVRDTVFLPRVKFQWDGSAALGNKVILQPSVGYLWAPYHSMSHLPLFDTRARPFLMNQLFSYDRYFGYSRLGDYNDMDVRIRVMHKRFPGIISLGQRYSFSLHKQYILSGYKYIDPNAEKHLSPFLISTYWPYDRGYIYTDMSIDYQVKNIQNVEFGTSYKLSRGQARLYAAKFYRFIDDKRLPDPLRVVGLDTSWDMNQNWSSKLSVFAEVRHKVLAGAEAYLSYHDCCFDGSLSIKRSIQQDDMIHPLSGVTFKLKLSLNGLK